MRIHSSLIGTLALLLAALTATPAAAAAAGPVRVIQSDERGVTLQFDVPEMSLTLQRDGRSVLHAASLDVTNQPGRPALPYASALIALPPGARAVPRVIASGTEDVRSGVRLASNSRSIIRRIDDTETFEPVVEPVDPIVDGPWPPSIVELGEEHTLRRQRMVSVRILPYRYDEASGKLWTRRSVTVRVDFVGGRTADGVPSRDAHWDRVLRGSVLNFDQARAWRARPEPLRSRGTSLLDDARGRRAGELSATAVQAFDEGNAEVRVQTDTTGVYAFRFDDLVTRGYPIGVPIGQVSVHRHEFLENANPSYATVEVPIEVDDANSNAVFDAGDRIVLYVLSWAQRSRASQAQRAWGDGEVFYVTFIADRAPLRLAARPGWRDLTLTPLLSYPYTERFEKIVSYTRLPPDTNSDQFQMSSPLFFPRPDSFVIETHDIDTTGRVTSTVKWGSSRATTHALWAHIRNFRSQFTSLGDSVRWFGLSSFSYTTSIFGSSLTEGPTNVLRTWGKSPGSDLAYAWLDWLQLTYWRNYHALEGKLDCNSGTTTGAYQIQAYGFNSNALRVYDVTDSLNPVRLAIDPSHIEFDGAEYTISFQDSSASPRRYWVFDQPKVVPASRMGAVVRRDLTNSAPSNYLMVVPEAWLALATPLAEFRRAQGYTVLVAPLESVMDEFNGGRRSSYALKRFFKYAFDRWDSEFAVMLGDGSEDPQNLLGDSGADWIPAQKIMGPVPSGDGLESIPSDTWFVSLENPSLPSLFLGRIPAKSPEALSAVIAKLIQYETVTPEQTWRRDMLLVADDKYSTVTEFGGGGGSSTQYCEKDYEKVFKALSDSLRVIVVRDAGLSLGNVEVFNLDYYLRAGEVEPFRIAANGDTCRIRVDQTQVRTRAVVSPFVFARLNQGRLWWNFQGHANQYILSHESIYLNGAFDDDKQYLNNVGKPFLFTAFSCHANGFAAAREEALGPSIGEDLVMLPDRGAIAAWASAGYEILPTPVERSEHLNTRLARQLFADPPRDPQDNAARVVLGEAIVSTLLVNYSAEFAPTERDVAKSYLLLGDPATRISVGAPQIVVTANGVPVTHGEPVRLFSFGDTLRLEALVASNVRIQTLTVEFRDQAGSRIMNPSEYIVSPAFPDTGAGSSGGNRFSISIGSRLSAGSYRYVIRSVDRAGVASQFDVVFEFQTVLRAGGEPIRPNDPVRADADLSVLILSPGPIDPGTDIELLLNGTPLAFAAAPFQGDTTRREYVLSWNHAPYAVGTYAVTVRLGGQDVALFSFTVSDQSGFADLMAFPNPFDDELGTRFSFTFTGAQPFDLLLRVYTVSGRLIYQRIDRGLQPGYHQLAWDGRDDEGQKLANGIYFYKMLAKSDAGDVVEQGRLVKLRRPRRADPEGEITPP